MPEGRYGICSKCGTDLEPVWFIEKETKIEYGSLHRTGRVRESVSHLECPVCLTSECVDDSFDGPWYYPRNKEV